MSKETTKGPNTVATVAVATATKERISNGYDERAVFNGRGSAKVGHEESNVLGVGVPVSTDTMLSSQMVTDSLSRAQPETWGAHPGGESCPLRNGNLSESVSSVESHRASSDSAEFVPSHTLSLQTLSQTLSQTSSPQTLSQMSVQTLLPQTLSSQTLPSQTLLPQTPPLQTLSQTSSSQALLPQALSSQAVLPQTLSSQTSSLQTSSAQTLPQTLPSHSLSQTLLSQTLSPQTFPCDKGECQNVREADVVVQNKNSSSCGQSLSSTKVCDRISGPRTDSESDGCCQPVVTLHCATSNATGTLATLDDNRVTDLHSNTSSARTNISCTFSSGGNATAKSGITTTIVSQANVPTYATSILSKDSNCLTTSISTASQVVMATFSAGIQCKENCAKMGTAGIPVPVACPTSTSVMPATNVGSTSTVTSMQSSCKVSSNDATILSATKESVDRAIEGCIEKTLALKFGAAPSGEIGSVKDAEKQVIQNPGKLDQRFADVVVQNKVVCPEALDLEARGCTTEPAINSESLKDPLVMDRTKGEIFTGGSSMETRETGAEADVDSRRLEDPLASDRRYDRRSVTSISSDSRLEMRCELPTGCIVPSQSTEKIVARPNPNCARFFGGGGGTGGGGIVRGSRSQENYFDSGDIMCVDIDLDDIASSVDALHYDTSSMVSLDSLSVADWPMDESEDEQCLEEIEASQSISGDAHFPSPPDPTTTSAKFVASTPISKATTSRTCDESRAGHGVALSISAVEIENAFNAPDCTRLGDGATAASNLSKDGSKQYAFTPENATSSSAVTATSNSAPVTKDSVLDSRTKINEPASPGDLDRDGRDVESGGVAGQNQDFDFIFRDESFFRQPSKDVDRPSAARLAKRLFFLHGFRRSDVSRHLSKRNSFSQLVGEEYLKYFDFAGQQLDCALRQFMKHVTVFGESQDRERLLVHFSARYQQCNPEIFKSEVCCHTLSCALLLLNNDLNGQNIGRKITAVEFISNMADMNDGEQFPRELLEGFYTSIKEQPLEFEAEDVHDSILGSASGSPTSSQSTAQGRFISYNPFYEIPDPCNAVEYKKGYIMRKCCLEPDGRKTPLGKRGWKMFYATLRDMVLHLHVDEHGFKRNQQYASATNLVHIHHSLATKATDYQKKNHVFRLQTADLAQYLIQTSDTKECQEWIDAINFVAASYSAPPSNSSGASQKRFQRPLLPSTYTRLNLREQIGHHEKMIAEFDRELVDHRKNPPEKGAKTRLIQDYCKKENYLKFELKRYKTYCRLLQYKVSTFPELEPSLAETVIGEVEEPSSSPPVNPPFGDHCPNFLPAPTADVPPQSSRQFQT